MTPREKIHRAEVATRQVIDRIDTVIGRLQWSEGTVNAAGVFRDPVTLSTNLHVVMDELQKALRIMADTKWPTDSDYTAD